MVHSIGKKDVDGKIAPPDINAVGTRLYYKFAGKMN